MGRRIKKLEIVCYGTYDSPIILARDVNIKFDGKDIGNKINYFKLEGVASDMFFYDFGFIKQNENPVTKLKASWLFLVYSIKQLFRRAK